MDFPKSVPSVGLVDGKFIDEDAVAGTPGSLIPSAWGNAVTLEVLKVIEDAGLVPDEDDNTQLSAAIQALVDAQAVSFATQLEAEEGINTTKAMSPLRVFQAIAKAVAQATEAEFGWLKIATQTQVNAGTDDAAAITAKKMAAAAQAQAHTAFTTAGTAAALTLTPAPAIASYAPNQRFRVKFSQNSTGTGTINVSGRGGKGLKQYDSSGAKVAAIYAVDQLADIEYDGTDFVLLDQLPTGTLVGIQGSAKSLTGSTTGLSAVATFAADEIMVESASNSYQVLRAVSITPSLANAIGANGLDAGSVGGVASTWYSVWVIWNGTTTAGLFSTNATSPTMPSGYTHKALMGWVRTDATGNKYLLGMTWAGSRWSWKVAAGSSVLAMPLMASGSVGSISTPTFIAVAWANYAPPTAKRLTVVSSNGSGTTIVAPNNAYGASTSTTNPSPVQNSAGTAQLSWLADLILESSNIYWASNAGGAGLFASGGEI
ncbi:hypothetical protein ACJ6YJ_03620 [Pseudomonas marginalis]|uniref:hypothetical protein n=1 Tax=Pseudomonas TaxID=286 RepID=UPI00389AAE09